MSSQNTSVYTPETQTGVALLNGNGRLRSNISLKADEPRVLGQEFGVDVSSNGKLNVSSRHSSMIFSVNNNISASDQNEPKTLLDQIKKRNESNKLALSSNEINKTEKTEDNDQSSNTSSVKKIREIFSVGTSTKKGSDVFLPDSDTAKNYPLKSPCKSTVNINQESKQANNVELSANENKSTFELNSSSKTVERPNLPKRTATLSIRSHNNSTSTRDISSNLPNNDSLEQPIPRAQSVTINLNESPKPNNDTQIDTESIKTALLSRQKSKNMHENLIVTLNPPQDTQNSSNEQSSAYSIAKNTMKNFLSKAGKKEPASRMVISGPLEIQGNLPQVHMAPINNNNLTVNNNNSSSRGVGGLSRKLSRRLTSSTSGRDSSGVMETFRRKSSTSNDHSQDVFGRVSMTVKNIQESSTISESTSSNSLVDLANALDSHEPTNSQSASLPRTRQIRTFRSKTGKKIVEIDIDDENAIKIAKSLVVLSEEDNSILRVINTKRLTYPRIPLRPTMVQKNMTGLYNGTQRLCSVNAVLQCLASLDFIASYFLAKTFAVDLNKQSPTRSTVAIAFENIINKLYSEESIVSSSFIRDEMEIYHPSLVGSEDAHEFLCFLLQVLHDDLNRTIKLPNLKYSEEEAYALPLPERALFVINNVYLKSNSIVTDLFMGLFESTIRCYSCGHTSVTFETFTTVALNIGLTDTTIIECLANFSAPEDLESPFMCSGCRHPAKASKTMRILKYPDYFIINLNRVGKDETGQLKKLTTKVTFESDYNLIINTRNVGQSGYSNDTLPINQDDVATLQSSFGFDSQTLEEPFVNFKLSAVIQHKGDSYNNGHFYASVYSSASDCWFDKDDDDVSKIPLNGTSGESPSNVCIMIFKRIPTVSPVLQ